ncbi:MAG: SRPBCC family protein [Hyphomicrobiales bacterium]|nr:SRPBCC family protein [Hyphomicrobiales bacterium]
MYQLIRLVIGVAFLAAILVAVAFVLPSNISVARATVVNAPEGDVFPFLNSPRQFNRWSPWAARDPKTAYTFSGPPQGKGARMEWKSEHPQVGSGTQEIVESRLNSYVEVALDFGDMGNATATYRLTPAGAGTKVTWGFNTDVGANPLMRWMGLMFDRWVGADYEDGLGRLKKLVESGG